MCTLPIQVFDETKGNKRFAFKLGVGEVIKGWDKGVVGMRVGDKRKLVVPPAMAYGNTGAAPMPACVGQLGSSLSCASQSVSLCWMFLHTDTMRQNHGHSPIRCLRVCSNFWCCSTSSRGAHNMRCLAVRCNATCPMGLEML